MKEEELWFFKQVCERCSNHGISEEKNERRSTIKENMFWGMMKVHITPRDIINEPNFPFHYKRAWYYLEKWGDKNWYEWGVTMDLGWITKEGQQQYELLIYGNTSRESISIS